MRTVFVLFCAALLASAGCDRRVEPFDPSEQPRQPDLSKIFPEGAQQAQALEPALPPPPGGGRGAAPVAQEVAAPEPTGEAIRGRIEVAPELADRVPDGAVLFIIGRRGGGGPPLAVKRVSGPSFPLPFSLGPEDRMMQQIPFTGPITLSARLDADGNASSSEPGDLSGSARSGPVEPGASDVVIVLDTAVE